jgi:hypothetical protein
MLAHARGSGRFSIGHYPHLRDCPISNVGHGDHTAH